MTILTMVMKKGKKKDQGSRKKDQGSSIKDQGSRIKGIRDWQMLTARVVNNVPLNLGSDLLKISRFTILLFQTSNAFLKDSYKDGYDKKNVLKMGGDITLTHRKANFPVSCSRG